MYLILFDCDGTLVDSQNLIVGAMSAGFAANGLTPPDRERILGVVGLSLPIAIDRLLDDGEGQHVDAIAEGYRKAFFEIRQDSNISEPLYDGTHQAIAGLSARDDVLLGIATGKSRRGVDALLDSHGLTGQFVTIQTSDNNPSKPHPSMIETALAEAGVERDRCAIIGDTSYDMEMGRAAGVAGVGVDWGYHPKSALEGAGARTVLGHFDELVPALAGIFDWNG